MSRGIMEIDVEGDGSKRGRPTEGGKQEPPNHDITRFNLDNGASRRGEPTNHLQHP